MNDKPNLAVVAGVGPDSATEANAVPVHDMPQPSYSFERLEALWRRHPERHEMTTFATVDQLLEDHESYQDGFVEVEREYRENRYDQFLVRLSWDDLAYRHATMELVREHVSPPNPYADAFMAQFDDLGTDALAYFVFPESYASQFLVVMDVCKRAESLAVVKGLFPDEVRPHYLAAFDKRNMDDVLLMFHLVYAQSFGELYGGYSLYDYALSWYQTHLRERGTVLRSPYLPDRIAKYQGSPPFHFNPVKTVHVRRNVDHILECGYFASELDFFLSLTTRIMPLFQWLYEDIALYEEADGYRCDWRLARTRIRTRLTAEGVIKPKWKHELSLFHAVRSLYPDTLYQYRPDWLGRQSLDLYVPSIGAAIEYQGVQHYQPVEFFGGEQALAQRQALDETKRALCLENGVHLIEWPYDLEPTEKNVRGMLAR